MLLALPYHPSLPVSYERVVADIKRLAGNMQHGVLVISRPQDEQAGLDIAMDLSSSFGRHFTATLVKEGSTPIETANMFLATSLRFLAKYRPEHPPEPVEVPMVYLDPQWRPRAKHWLDRLQGEWFLRGKPPVLGNYKDPEKPDFEGAVVFGPSYPRKSSLIDFLPADNHWRRFLAWEMFQNSVLTDSIGDDPKALVHPRPETQVKRS